MRNRNELIPFAAGIVLAAYLVQRVPTEAVKYLVPYALLLIPGIKRKSLPFAASSLFALAFLEWLLVHDYIAIIVMGMALLETPIRMGKQPVKLWERVINVIVAGAVAYVSVISPETAFKIVGVLTAIGLLSSNRSISGGALVTASAFFVGIALSGTSDMNPDLFIGVGALLLLYSLNHLRKLLR
ncbi:hypothetical protein [Thermococcus gammatolerans]|uniref:Uncharacterized protein n=1 Tax=Thermococcus gammatolerans (strain DSM 15229 / JCM 11827 / EJ3) TaxID=593117 RepID=C5A3L3_THEGJ|nr:hypothetical protein [Thermococcus gammatolerans]ACS32825.1 Conserved hypothetical protein [Thermococcus gammatolerans EJ3]